MEKVAVLGIGPSLHLFDPQDFDLLIGVNDIWRFVETEVVVCLDHAVRFSLKRLRVIEKCQPKAFYSQIQSWHKKKGFEKIELYSQYPDTKVNILGEKYEKSYCSPFVACQIAFREYRAKEIHLFGVDMINHPHLTGSMLPRIVRHFKNLQSALRPHSRIIVYGDGILRGL
ncbi:MAG: hypothetical protein WDA29_10425 [Flavobacteriaceae bacterium]|jgi:hypothetical protein|nr:hypothetical protein [Candidatus Kapabacteria bacterium]